MKEHFASKHLPVGNNALFLDDLPKPPKYQKQNDNDPTMIEVKKWRLQVLLAVNPWGIPSLAFGEAYHKMFGKELDVRGMGFKHLSDMVCQMPDIFAVQEPDECTQILFPDHPSDQILHDARLGLDFSRPNFDDQIRSVSFNGSSDRMSSTGGLCNSKFMHSTSSNGEFNELVHRAWINRDEEFPPDVVLAGEPYDELLIISSAQLKGTRGLYQATILSAASPDSFYVHLKTNEHDERLIQELPIKIAEYFETTRYPIEAYSVPREFMYPGFPCLVYVGKDGRASWERCLIAAHSRKARKVLVEAVDYGGWYAVDPIYLYLIPRNFLEVPRRTFHVALAGLKPASTEKDLWPSKAGARIRCFSYQNYYLDLLLMDPKPRDYRQLEKQQSTANSSSELDKEDSLCSSSSKKDSFDVCDRSSFSSNANATDEATKAERMKRRFKRQPRFDALVIDRNAEDIDLFLDEILVMETYADFDANHKNEIDQIKTNLKDVLKTLPGPVNPYYAENNVQDS